MDDFVNEMQDFVYEMDDLVSEMRDSVHEMSQSVNKMADSVNETKDFVDEVGDSVSEVHDSVHEMEDFVTMREGHVIQAQGNQLVQLPRERVHGLRARQREAGKLPSMRAGLWRREELGWMLGGALATLALAGCRDNLRSAPTGAASNTPSTPHAAASAGVVPAETRPRPGDAIEGSWLSSSCGERAYARIISFHGGRFTAEDRIAPCPPGAQCIWSGVVYRTGSYSISADGKLLQLSLERADAKQPGAPFPDQLELDPGPVERSTAESGPLRCEYVRR